MRTYTTGNDIVDGMTAIHMTGNIIPSAWYHTVLRSNGKPHLLAIITLAEIAYWYRPQEVRDEETGQLIGYRKRFKDDLLQRSYDQLAELFGETKRSVTDAVVLLEKLGVIKRVFRTIMVNGTRYNNVLYLELIPDKLYELTYPEEVTPVTKERDRECREKDTLSRNNVRPVTEKCGTCHEIKGEVSRQNVRQNTKNTTENTTEIISSSKRATSEQMDDDYIRKKIDLDNAVSIYPGTAETIFTSLCDISKDGKHNDVLNAVLHADAFKDLCRNIEEHATPINNVRAYITACVSNMAAGRKIVNTGNSFNRHLMKRDYGMNELEIENALLAN